MEHSYRYRLRFGTRSGCQNFRASFQGFSKTSKRRTEAYRMHVGTDFLKLPPVTGQYWSLFQCSMPGTGGTCVVAKTLFVSMSDAASPKRQSVDDETVDLTAESQQEDTPKKGRKKS